MHKQKFNEEPSSSKKRARDKPNKRWSDEEIKNILQYMRHNQEFEKPTARIYYTKLLESVDIDATWDILKWKVRHLKDNYNKAEEWRKEAGLLDSDEGLCSIKEKLQQMCKFYKDLHDVFGQKSEDFPFETYESSSSKNMLNSTTISDDIPEFLYSEALDESFVAENEHYQLNIKVEVDPELSVSEPTEKNLINEKTSINEKNLINEKKVKNFAKKLRTSAPKTAIERLCALQTEKNEYFKSKMEFEKSKFSKELDLNERKFLEDVKKRKDEMEIKKIEIEKDERLGRLKIESEEKIKMYEIEMKYKYQK